MSSRFQSRVLDEVPEGLQELTGDARIDDARIREEGGEALTSARRLPPSALRAEVAAVDVVGSIVAAG